MVLAMGTATITATKGNMTVGGYYGAGKSVVRVRFFYTQDTPWMREWLRQIRYVLEVFLSKLHSGTLTPKLCKFTA